MTNPMDRGELWSFLRSCLSQGGDIWLDHKETSYEQYSARLDAAARERVPKLMQLLGDEITQLRGNLSLAEEGLANSALEVERLKVRINGYADTNVELRQMLREARAGFDVIANKNGEPRWDLAKRIDTALGDAHEPRVSPAEDLWMLLLADVNEEPCRWLGLRNGLHDWQRCIRGSASKPADLVCAGPQFLIHPSRAHQAACPVCNPTKTVPELNAAVGASAALQEWRDSCSCGCDACIELIETLGLEVTAQKSLESNSEG